MTWKAIEDKLVDLWHHILPLPAPSDQPHLCRAPETCLCKVCAPKTEAHVIPSTSISLKTLLVLVGQLIISILQFPFLLLFGYANQSSPPPAKPARKKKKKLVKLDKEITKIRADIIAMTSSEDSKLPFALLALAMALEARYKMRKKPSNLEEAIEYYECLAKSPSFEEDGAQALMLLCLAHALALRFEHSKDVADINRAIDSHRRALDLSPSNAPLSLIHQLGLAQGRLTLLTSEQPLSEEDAEEAAQILAEFKASLPNEEELQERLERLH